jgi:predicted nuclease of predicted toxin-antitoxin system
VTFVFDENLSPRHAARLRDLGMTLLRSPKSGFRERAIRWFALLPHWTRLDTMGADFANVLRYLAAATPGVVWLRLHPPTEASIAAAVDRVLAKLGAENLNGKLVVVDQDKIRVRG